MAKRAAKPDGGADETTEGDAPLKATLGFEAFVAGIARVKPTGQMPPEPGTKRSAQPGRKTPSRSRRSRPKKAT